MGDSQTRLRAAPADIRSDAGYQLDFVQLGEAPEDFRPMPDVGAGVMEIRIHGENEYRVYECLRGGWASATPSEQIRVRSRANQVKVLAINLVDQ